MGLDSADEARKLVNQRKIDKANAKIIKEIETKMIELRSQGAVKPLKLKATEEQIKKGAPTNYEIPVSFDNANFFV